MPKAKNNPLLKGVSGKLGNTFGIRQTRYGIVIANKPGKPKGVGPVQRALRSRFMEAVDYARHQTKHAEGLALYKSRVTKRLNSAYTVALTDYLTKPQINVIDFEGYSGAVGQPIDVHASDDFQVDSVTIMIRNVGGEEIERGQATLLTNMKDHWVYTSVKENPSPKGSEVIILVRDIPGNISSATVTL